MSVLSGLNGQLIKYDQKPKNGIEGDGKKPPHLMPVVRRLTKLSNSVIIVKLVN